MAVNLWDDADKATPKSAPTAPRPIEPRSTLPAKQEKVLDPVWNVEVDFNGQKVDFPLTYVIQHNSPWVYFEVLKTLYPPIMPKDLSPEEASAPGGIVFEFTSALNKAIDEKLVPKNPIYGRAKIVTQNLALTLAEATKKLHGEHGPGESAVDLMEAVAAQHPDAMANVTPNSPAWNAIRGRILKELNQNNILADEHGKSNALQQKNIEGRGGPIRSIILNTLRAMGLIRV